MNIDDGLMRRLGLDEKPRENEVIVPEKDEEAVINMTRQQRRAWARRQVKAQQRSKQ
jgi:hypothetical protein